MKATPSHCISFLYMYCNMGYLYRDFCLFVFSSSKETLTVPDLVACWCDVHGPALHSASCCLGGRVSPLRDSQSWGWRPLRRHQRVLTLLPHVPISTDMAMAQSPWAGHILWDTVICGHFYGSMQRRSIWQLGTKGDELRVLSTTLPCFINFNNRKCCSTVNTAKH